MTRLQTLRDFNNDGRAVLGYLVAASPWGSIDQAIASLSVFAHPDVVEAAGRRAMFRTVRGRVSDRGTIVDGVMVDDNASPAMAFEWSTSFRRAAGTDVTCCHLYARSGDASAYTDLRNLFYAPSFISRLTDSQAASLPAGHALGVLRRRSFDLFGYRGPDGAAEPPRPDHYDGLEWADPIGEGVCAQELEERLRARLARRPRDRITRSVALCGWAFSDDRPDADVHYAGR